VYLTNNQNTIKIQTVKFQRFGDIATAS